MSSRDALTDALQADSDTLGRLHLAPLEGRQRLHYDTLSSPHQPPPALVLSDDCGPAGAVGAWAPPPLPPGLQDLPRDYGPDGAACGLIRHKRRMELVELSGRTTGRLGYTWLTTAHAIGGTATLALRYSIISASAAARTRP